MLGKQPIDVAQTLREPPKDYDYYYGHMDEGKRYLMP